MAVSLPYLASPGSIKNALERIRTAATPDRVTGDFVTTKLQIKGGTGAALIPYLKKIGFVAPDGAPTEIYRRFRNHATAGLALADSVKLGYRELERANEYFHALPDKDLLALIVQVTGVEEGNQVARLTLSTLKMLKASANFEAKQASESPEKGENPLKGAFTQTSPHGGAERASLGLNLSYTINLNLPATSDQAVFNAIFRSLKEHLLSKND